MKLHVISTGSKGNAYILCADDGILLLDAGIRYQSILRELVPYGGLCNLAGCVVTHEHMDHIRAVPELARRGITCYMSSGTRNAMALPTGRCRALEPLEKVIAGPFTIVPFKTEHDAIEPFGYLIRHNQTGEQALYATDTYFLRHTFPGTHYWIVECNYCEEILRQDKEAGRIHQDLYNRLAKSHLSLERLKQTLAANDLSKTRAIVLIHLSDERSNEEQMVREISEQTGKRTVAARDGLDVDLSLSPF